MQNAVTRWQSIKCGTKGHIIFWMPNNCAVPLKQYILKHNNNSVNDAGFKESYHVLEAHIY